MKKIDLLLKINRGYFNPPTEINQKYSISIPF